MSPESWELSSPSPTPKHQAPLCTCVGYSVLQGPATRMVRPHPGAWRLIHGVLVCYLLFMVFLLFQDVHDARQFLRVRL